MDLSSIFSGSNLITSGSALIVLQSIWSKISGYISFLGLLLKESIVYNLTYSSSSLKNYLGALKFLKSKDFLYNSRNISASIVDSSLCITEDRFGIKFYKNNLIFFYFHVRDLENGVDKWTSGEGTTVVTKEEALTIYYFGFSKSLRDEIENEIKEFSQKKPEDLKHTLFVIKDEIEYKYPKRTEDSIFLPKNEYKKIKKDVTSFLNRENQYIQKCIPYKRVYLLEGLPGTGKTSLVKTLASEFNKTLFIINKIDNLQNSDLINQCKNKECFCLIEEIDTFSTSRDDDEKSDSLVKLANSTTLQTLLTTLDGIMTPHGLVLFMTTNYVQNLDPALIRPGRVDYKLNFGQLDDHQIKQACKFYSEHSWETSFNEIKSLKPKSMAEVQEILIQKYLS